LHFDMNVERVAETPRITKPMREDLWARAKKAGDQLDDMITSDDVRLTVGGEPTFVAAQDRDADEWNTDATGPTKEFYADKLLHRLKKRFAPTGFLHFGQGKWYPGETLPRWAYGAYWRRDGQPIWHDPSLIAGSDESVVAKGSAEDFAEGLAQALGIDADYVQPAYEDPADFMLRERQLPDNVDPINNKLDDAEARERLARVFEGGLGNPVSFNIPIQAAQARAARQSDAQDALAKAAARRRYLWRSERWRIRRGQLFLTPGDSAAGYRLPLTSLPYLEKEDRPQIFPVDPTAPRGRLFAPAPQMQPRGNWAYGSGTEGGAGALPPNQVPMEDFSYLDDDVTWPPPTSNTAYTYSMTGPVRTAISVEERRGILYVFMPPVASAEEYLDLVAAVEDTASILRIPARIEGYPPPSDYRLNVLKVTPDPGVIEVNIQPASTWQEQVNITEVLYEEAAACGLEASKFL
ncbi:MAG: transglutaminase family protein, partial [Pseudomonadota bacterium]